MVLAFSCNKFNQLGVEKNPLRKNLQKAVKTIIREH